MSLILTKAGLNAYAQSEATGTKLQATHMAVGDGGGAPVAHTDTSEALVNETWRGELQSIEVAASGEVEFTGHVPITVGGWYIREIAIYGGETLLALSSHPETWKPAPEAPDKVELLITAPVKFANAAVINLTVDTTKVLASQEHVAGRIAEHDESAEAHSGIQNGLSDHIKNKDAHGGPHAAKDHTHKTEEVTDLLSESHTYSAPQGYEQALLEIEDGTVAWDCSVVPSAILYLDDDVTEMVIGRYRPGDAYDLTIVQGPGGKACTMPSALLWPDGEGYEPETDAGTIDRIYLAPFTDPKDGKVKVLATAEYSYKEAE
ncbi:phage tail protein [Pseudodesulfovibrio karagichevae]|uniref:Phage tail protein n=1 Tax=Pseudodesulfovibrio karagichevae TaxID=3239305 RepID=A0ABV4K1B6_9BACT